VNFHTISRLNMSYLTVHPNLKVHYEVWGSKSEFTVVLCHPRKSNSLIWYNQINHFVSKGVQVITMDSRGYGRSIPLNMEHCTHELIHPKNYADDLRQILSKEEIKNKVIIICMAMGGWVGLWFSLKFPDLVQKLILCASPGALLLPELVLQYNSSDSANKYSSTFGPFSGHGIVEWQQYLADFELSPGYEEIHPERALLFRFICEQNKPLPPHINQSTLLLESAIPLEQIIGISQKVPTEVIAGSKDSNWRPTALKQVAIHLGANFREIPGWGHTPAFEHPEEFNKLMDEICFGIS